VRQTEAVIGALEGAHESMLFGSGMAAATSVVLALPPGSRVLARRCATGASRLADHEAPLFGYHVDLVDMTDLAAVRATMKRDTRLVWIETPGNPLWNITDIAAVAEIAHAGGAVLGVDSTVATPVFTRPLALGADIVMHSATKYLNGHSDVIAGALATARDDALWARIRQVRAITARSSGHLRLGCCCADCARSKSACAPRPRTRRCSQAASRAIPPCRPSSIRASRRIQATRSR